MTSTFHSIETARRSLFTQTAALNTTGHNIANANTEGYSRQTVTWSAPTGDPSSTGNSALVTFGPFSADLGIVSHIMLMDVVTGGVAANCLAYWSADVVKDPANGDSITIGIGALVMTAD